MFIKVLRSAFAFLFFVIPLVFFPRSSELFEFNKIVVLYVLTTIITTTWMLECIYAKKVIFKHSPLDIPLLLFLGSQVVSTFLSIDPHISLFGYYSRFNGGLISVTCYVLLYWCFVTHFHRTDVIKSVLVLCIATAITSVWGLLEHMGKSPSCLIITHQFDVSCWVQDVQLRVYATFGQPNWMAAWTVALIPVTWAFLLEQKSIRTKKALSVIALQTLFFLALLFTKSRSGAIAFMAADAFFWILMFFSNWSAKAFIFKFFAITHCLLLIAVILIGTPLTPSVSELMHRSESVASAPQSAGPALETGGTESGEIRKIVWQGAVSVWKQFPIFGSGVETFALSYYRGRPMAHNLVSEWNFLYNKAHNEYLNYLATTGLVGLTTYLMVIGISGFTCLIGVRPRSFKISAFSTLSPFQYALGAGFISILITNFFGFSVVPVSLLFFLFPGFGFSMQSHKSDEIKTRTHFDTPQLLGFLGLLLVAAVALFGIAQYWYADYHYARAKELQSNNDYAQSIREYHKAIAASPAEATYHADLASLFAELASAAATNAESKSSVDAFTAAALTQIDEVLTLSPQNVKLLKSVANSYSSLGDTNALYIEKTRQMTARLEELAPTDPSVEYQKMLTLAQLNRLDEAIGTGEKTIAMKPNYKLARQLLSYLYKQKGDSQKAKEQLEYILKYISPNDPEIKKGLDSINSSRAL